MYFYNTSGIQSLARGVLISVTLRWVRDQHMSWAPWNMAHGFNCASDLLGICLMTLKGDIVVNKTLDIHEQF